MATLTKTASAGKAPAATGKAPSLAKAPAAAAATKTATPAAPAASGSASGTPAPAKSGPDPITGTDLLNHAKDFGQGTYSRATAGDAKGAILTAVLLTAGSALISQLVQPKPGGVRPFAKIIVGGFLMGGALTLLAEADPRVAKALGWVITISAILINGQTLFSVVGTTVAPATGGPSKPIPPAPANPGGAPGAGVNKKGN